MNEDVKFGGLDDRCPWNGGHRASYLSSTGRKFSTVLFAALLASVVGAGRADELPKPSAAALAAKAPAAPAFQVDPHPAIRPEANDAIRMFRFNHFFPPGKEIPDGFVDGGRGMSIHGDGRLSSYRELMEVDRKKDAFLRGYIEHVRQKEFMELDPLARAARVGMYVDTLLSRVGGRRHAEEQWDKLDAQYANRGLLLGEIAGVAGSGVCRHRSQLFKILADAAGLKVSVVRGNYRHSSGKLGGHEWNELYLDDGSIYLVDTMNPPKGWKFPSITNPSCLKYVSVAGKPLYEGGKVPWPAADLPAAKPELKKAG